MTNKEVYIKSKIIEYPNEVCSTCEDEPEYCFECDKDLSGDKYFYCDHFGQHLCVSCYKKLKQNLKEKE